jgi:putative exporter of polyketide antibiotics
MIWLFLILALSTVAVLLVGIAAYLRVRRHVKEASGEAHGKD